MGNITNKEEKSFPLTIRKIKKYGWTMDVPDTRDIYANIPEINNILPRVDLRSSGFLPEIYDQKDLGSCTAHSVMTAYMYDLNKNKKKLDFDPSVSFVYYNQRVITNSVNFDSGSSIRDAMKVITKLGVCSNNLYPYDTVFFTDKPSEEAYKQASDNINEMLYKRIKPDINNILKVLSYDIPVIFGFSVYESFDSQDTIRTGLVPVPSYNESIIGSKTAVIVGYDTNKKYLICCNSGGKKWGALGYFWIPFSFINERYCSDFWIFYSKKTKNTSQKVTPSPQRRQNNPQMITPTSSPPPVSSSPIQTETQLKPLPVVSTNVPMPRPDTEQQISEEIKDVYKSPVFEQQKIVQNMQSISLNKEAIEDLSENDDKSEYGYVSDED